MPGEYGEPRRRGRARVGDGHLGLVCVAPAAGATLGGAAVDS